MYVSAIDKHVPLRIYTLGMKDGNPGIVRARARLLLSLERYKRGLQNLDNLKGLIL